MTQQKIRVLHIDDDREFLELFRSTYCGEFDILSLSAGTDVLTVLSRETIDALVLDYELPGKTGLEVLQEIRAHYPSIPVVFYTGQGNEEIARKAFQSGATDYFVKEASDFAQKEKVTNSVHKAVEKCAIEAELKEKQAMLESFIEHNPYSIQLYDREGRISRINRAHTELFGASAVYQKGITFDDSFPIPDEIKEAMLLEWEKGQHQYTPLTDKSIQEGDPTGELIFRWKEGEVVKYPPFWYTIPFPVSGAAIKRKCLGGTAFSVRDAHGRILHYVFMHEDVTARIEAETEARKAHQELEKAYADLREAYGSVERQVANRTAELADANMKLQEMNRQLEKKNGELECFAHRVSHDMRNNLLVMQRLVETGAMDPGEVKKNAELLIGTTVYLREFTERMLMLAQAGKTIGDTCLVHADRIAREVFSRLASSQNGAELRCAPSFPKVLCDPAALDTIFTNLFDNALYHCNDVKPLIDVDFMSGDGVIDIIVSDNGSGIAPEAFPHLFEAAWTTRKERSFGFGLAIVKKIVEAHDGSVKAENGAKGGAAFIITLPHRG